MSIQLLLHIYIDIILVIEDPKTSNGWKNHSTSFLDCAEHMVLEEYESCIKTKSYSFDESIHSHNANFTLITKLSKHGPEIILKPHQGSIKFAPDGTFFLILNISLSFYLTFVDPQYQIISIHPTAIPASMVKIGSNSGMTLIYLKVSMDCYAFNV